MCASGCNEPRQTVDYRLMRQFALLPGAVARNTGISAGHKEGAFCAYRVLPLTLVCPYWHDVAKTPERADTTAPWKALDCFNEL